MFISLVDHNVHIHIKTCMKIAFKQCFLPEIAFLDVSSQNSAKTSQIFQNIAKLKSMTMQMISDFMYFDTIGLRQKNAIWKVDGYIIILVQCIYVSLKGRGCDAVQAYDQVLNKNKKMSSFKSNENIQQKEDGSYYGIG